MEHTGVPSYPRAVGRQVRALRAVSYCFHALLLPSASLRMVFGYAHMFIHADSYKLKDACSGHDPLCMC